MALLPIRWYLSPEMLMNNSQSRPRHDALVPVYNDLGTVFGTNFTLKIHKKVCAGKKDKMDDGSQDNSFQTVHFELERFLKLDAMSIEAIICLYETMSLKRSASKSFSHSFMENEKSFHFELRFPTLRGGNPGRLVMCLFGHINVNPSCNQTSKVIADVPEKSNIACPDPDMHSALNKLATDLEYLKDHRCFSDVTIVCDSANLQAHKNILSARSPVFKAMFDHANSKENITGQVFVTDIYEPALRLILSYIYTCKLTAPLTSTLACDVLYAADKYQLPELKEKCIDFLEGTITIENVFNILPIALLHSESLKHKIFDWIGKNICIVDDMTEWLLLKEQKPHLATEILSYVVKLQNK